MGLDISKHIWLNVSRKIYSFYDQVSYNFQTLKCLPRDKHYYEHFLRCSIDVNQPSKYFKKKFCNQPNWSSLTELKGAMNGFLLNSCDWMLRMLRIFIISKKLTIIKQNFAVSAASGGPYDVIVLLAVELNTWTANFTFKFEYGVKIICSFYSYGTISYTFHHSTHNMHTCYFQNLANNF